MLSLSLDLSDLAAKVEGRGVELGEERRARRFSITFCRCARSFDEPPGMFCVAGGSANESARLAYQEGTGNEDAGGEVGGQLRAGGRESDGFRKVRGT
jgi:hypothetical protein